MIFSPLSGKPLVTQGFGQNPDIYSQFSLSGHNGIDFGCPIGTVIYAPHDGVATIKDDGDQGYGKHIIIEDAKRKSVLAHLSEISVTNGQTIYQGDPIGKSGDTGFATAPHLHWTYKIMKNGSIQNKNNGYDGAVDVTQFTRLWLDQDLHYDAEYTEDAEAYKELALGEDAFLKNPNRTA